MTVVIQYNILKIFTKILHFSKINQIYFIVVLLMNERKFFEILKCLQCCPTIIIFSDIFILG